MEFYGSIDLVSGSVTASVFSGSFVGDAEGLYNIQASGVTGLNLSQIANGSNTASVSTEGFNVNTNTSITGALNVSGTITSQTTTLISGSSQVNITGTTGFSTFSSSISTSINTLSSSVATTTNTLSSSVATTTNNLSSSIATTDLNQNNRLDTIESRYATTGSNTFNGTQNISGSIIPTIDNAFDLGSATYQWRDVYISSGSLYIDGTKVLGSTAQELTITTDNGQSIKILENTTDSIILQVADGDIELKSSADGDILLDPTNGKIMLKGPVEVLSGQKIQSSVGGTPVVFANDIVVSGSIDLTGTIEGLNLTDFSSSLNSRLGAVESGGTSLNSFTASASSRLGSLETESGSIRTTVNSYTSSANSRLSSIETTTGSIISTNTTQTNRLDSVELKTGSYATTGSNSFNGNQTITGSLTVTQNLNVLGSASFLIVTSSQIAVSSSTISVNIFEPAERFGGLKVYDSGSESHLATASLLWDSLNNHWIYQNASGSNYSGGMLLAGPRNTGSLGQEVGLTSGKIAKSVGGDHLDNSIITETGGGIGINGNLVITGSIVASVTSLVSGSSQISFNGITDKPTLISGSSQVSFNTISDKPSLVSGSSQITFSGISGLPTLVSGSSQISFNSISDKPSLVSGSSQIDLTATTNYASGILTRLNAVGVVSGSSQITLDSTTGTLSVSKGGTGATTAANARTNLGLGTAAVSNTGDFATATQGTTADNALPKAGGALTGPLSITGTGTYLGDWGYNTLTLNDTSGYPGIFYKYGNNIWITRRNGGDNGFDYAYSTNASAQGTGTFTQIAKMTSSGDMYLKGQLYVGGNGASTGTQVVYNSGTWNISISGNSATATSATSATSATNSSQLGGLTKSQLWNNSGQNHGAYTSFSGITDFGNYFVHQDAGVTDGPAGNSYQYYVTNYGLGNDYAYSGAGSYAMQTAINRYGYGTTFYMYLRFKENNGWQSWNKLAAGYADSAGSVSGANVSGNISGNASNITSYTINQSVGSSNSPTFANTYVSGVYLRNAAGKGWLSGGYGTYEDSTTTGAIYSIGGSYYPTSTSFNNMHGVGYTHTNSTLLPTGPGTNGWGFYVLTNGTPNVWLGAEGPSWFAYNINPKTNGGASLGNSSYRWANVYTQDLHLSNDGKEGGNEIDGTTGDWTLQEGQENLYIINNKNGKKFKINLTEII